MVRPRRSLGNLPSEATSFVGRRRELADLRTKLSGARLVTLVGPGGVGKTRLAIRAGTALERGFRDGVWLVDLAPLRHPDAVAEAFLQGLEVRARAAAGVESILLAHLRSRDLLLMVDNCDHLLVETAAILAGILETAPGVRVIATSREPLSIAGEEVVAVAPLELPPPDPAEPLARLAQNEAVALFTERAAAASGRFELTPSNRAAVIELCRRLDGLPLALELAAVRTRVLSPDQILDRLVDRFGLLTGGSRTALPRHQTLRTAVEWSHDLLNVEERVLLRRLGVFAGRFDLDDIEAICAPGGATRTQTLDRLSSLVDKSLVVKEEASRRAVYRLHETMRDFARLKLREAGEEQAFQRRFEDHYVSCCRRSGAEARVRMLDWLDWLDVEIDNVRSVLRRVAAGDPGRGLDVAASLTWFWMTRETTEGVRRLDDLLRAAGPRGAVHAPGHFARGFLAVLQSDPATARPELKTAAANALRLGLTRLVAESLAMGSVAAAMGGDPVSATRLLAEAEAASACARDRLAQLAVLQARALAGLFAGHADEVVASSAEGAELARESGDLYTLEVMLINLGSVALVGGDTAGAGPPLEEALRIACLLDDRVAQAHLLEAFGCRAALTGSAALAARLMGAAGRVGAGAGADTMAFADALRERARARATATLGVTGFERERSAGEILGGQEAVRLALGEPVAAASPGYGPLSPRERGVAALVAEGLSNKQIGVRLFISERTVDSHVHSILNKLGFQSRAQVAAWIAARNP